MVSRRRSTTSRAGPASARARSTGTFRRANALVAAVYRDDIARLADQADDFGPRLPPDEALTAWLRVQLEYTKTQARLGRGDQDDAGYGLRDDWSGAGTRCGRRSVGCSPGRRRSAWCALDIEPTAVLRLVHGVGLASEGAPEQAESPAIDRHRWNTRGRNRRSMIVSRRQHWPASAVVIALPGCGYDRVPRRSVTI